MKDRVGMQILASKRTNGQIGNTTSISQFCAALYDGRSEKKIVLVRNSVDSCRESIYATYAQAYDAIPNSHQIVSECSVFIGVSPMYKNGTPENVKKKVRQILGFNYTGASHIWESRVIQERNFNGITLKGKLVTPNIISLITFVLKYPSISTVSHQSMITMGMGDIDHGTYGISKNQVFLTTMMLHAVEHRKSFCSVVLAFGNQASNGIGTYLLKFPPKSFIVEAIKYYIKYRKTFDKMYFTPDFLFAGTVFETKEAFDIFFKTLVELMPNTIHPDTNCPEDEDDWDEEDEDYDD